jgi:Cellulose binding domain
MRAVARPGADYVAMGWRRPGLLLWAMFLAAACAADPGDAPKDDDDAAVSSDAGSGASTGSSGGGSSDATSAPPPGDDAADATMPSAADDSSTPVVEASAPPPPPPSCTTCPLTVEYFSRTAPDHSSIAFDVAISNNGAMAQALSDLTLRYWFTANGITSFTAHMYYANLPSITTQTIAESFTSLSATSTPPATAMADTYMQVSFTQAAGSIGAMSSTNDIQLEFNDSTYAGTQTASNDYSYTATDLMTNCDQNNVLTCQTMTITLYRDAALVWGDEPGGAQASMADGGSGADADQ